MVPSFRKVNFFMSTWGMEDYRVRGEPFITQALRDHQPAFVLWNTASLSPENTGAYGLLPEDRNLIGNITSSIGAQLASQVRTPYSNHRVL